MANKKVEQLAFVDVLAVELIKHNITRDTLRFKTSSNVDAELNIVEGEANQLIVNNILIAQKRAIDTITGATIKMKDNVFSPQVISLLQGGTFEEDGDGNFTGYQAPKAGEEYVPETFDFAMYTAQRDQSGAIKQYAKILFPNCQGKVVQIAFEENTFFAPEYEMVSTPENGQSPYTITTMASLPSFEVDAEMDELKAVKASKK